MKSLIEKLEKWNQCHHLLVELVKQRYQTLSFTIRPRSSTQLGQLYAVGGEWLGLNLEKYCRLTKKWRKVEGLCVDESLSVLEDFPSVVLGNEIIMTGGLVRTTGIATNSVCLDKHSAYSEMND